MMTRCANCRSPLLREKEVRNLQKITWLNWEFNCPHCNAKLTTSCFWHEVSVMSGIVTIVVLTLFTVFEVLGSNEPIGGQNNLLVWVKLASFLALILVMVVSTLKLRTRELG